MSEIVFVHCIQNHKKLVIHRVTASVLIQNKSDFHYDMTKQRILTQNIIFGRTKD